MKRSTWYLIGMAAGAYAERAGVTTALVHLGGDVARLCAETLARDHVQRILEAAVQDENLDDQDDVDEDLVEDQLDEDGDWTKGADP